MFAACWVGVSIPRREAVTATATEAWGSIQRAPTAKAVGAPEDDKVHPNTDGVWTQVDGRAGSRMD